MVRQLRSPTCPWPDLTSPTYSPTWPWMSTNSSPTQRRSRPKNPTRRGNESHMLLRNLCRSCAMSFEPHDTIEWGLSFLQTEQIFKYVPCALNWNLCGFIAYFQFHLAQFHFFPEPYLQWGANACDPKWRLGVSNSEAVMGEQFLGRNKWGLNRKSHFRWSESFPSEQLLHLHRSCKLVIMGW